jgi:hypothetical protein
MFAFPQPAFHSFDWLRFKDTLVLKVELYNSRCLHSLSQVILSKTQMMQVLQGISGGREGIPEKSRKQEDGLLFDQHSFPRSHGNTTNEVKCVQIKPWGPMESTHPINYNNLRLLSKRKELQEHGHPEQILGLNHSEFPVYLTCQQEGSPPERCVVRSLEHRGQVTGKP